MPAPTTRIGVARASKSRVSSRRTGPCRQGCRGAAKQLRGGCRAAVERGLQQSLPVAPQTSGVDQTERLLCHRSKNVRSRNIAQTAKMLPSPRAHRSVLLRTSCTRSDL